MYFLFFFVHSGWEFSASAFLNTCMCVRFAPMESNFLLLAHRLSSFFFLSVCVCVWWKSMAKSIRTLKCDTQLECEPFLDIIAVMNVSMQVERKFFAGQWSHEETGRIFRSGSLNPMFSFFFFYYKKKIGDGLRKQKNVDKWAAFELHIYVNTGGVFFPSCI